MIFAAPEWLAADWSVKHLAEKHARPDGGFSAIPAAELRKLAAQFGKSQADVLKRYGYWADSGNVWL